MTAALPLGVMELRPYQQEITDSVVAGLRDGGLGQIHMACGSGKTVVGQRSTEELLPEGGTVAVMVPSLALAAQTLASWGRNGRRALEALVVCGDESVVDAAVHAEDLPVPVTTDTGAITSWLRRPPAASLRLVLCTYASGPRLADAVEATAPLDLVILDEGHHMAGRVEFTTRQILKPGRLPSRRRLTMTATPRDDLRFILADGSVEMVGMNDVEVFGPVLGRYSFARGIAEGYLEDYRIAVIGIPDSTARKLLADERVEYVEQAGGPSLQTIAAQVALGRAREQYGIRRVLTFHPRIEAAAEYSRTLTGNLARIAPGTQDGLYASHVHGRMEHRIRNRVLDRLRDTRDGWSVISNARCLGEGVDLPAVDAILFAHPKRSVVDITQAVGRALRRDPQVPGPSTIIVPVIVPDEDGEIGDLDPGTYDTLWQVVRALRAHDEGFGAALDHQRSHGSSVNPQLPEKITFMLPPGASQDFLARMKLLLVQQTTSPWWEGHHEAVRYHEEHGHLDVPSRHVTDSGHRLGQWILNARQHHRKGWMPADRITALDRIGMIWDTDQHRFDTVLARARAYRDHHGHLNVPQAHRDEDGYRLGTQINVLRRTRAKDRLPPDRIAALDELGMVWNTRDQANQRLIQAARDFHAAHGHLRVPRDHTTHDGYRLGNALTTRRNRYAHGDVHADVVRALDELGMIWDPREARFQDGLAACRRYRERHGGLDVPTTFTDPEGYNLGDFIAYQRALNTGSVRDRNGRTRTLPPERRTALDELGMIWTAAPARRPPTDEEITALLALPQQRGKPPATALLALVEAGVEQKALATALDMSPSALNNRITKARTPTPARPDAFTQNLDQARAHHQLHGHLRPLDTDTDPAARSLSDWLAKQRTARRSGKLTPEQIAALDELDMEWDPADARWQQSFQAARAYHATHGHLRPPAGTVQDGTDLPVWLSRQRTAHRNNTLPPERAAALNELGIDWTPGHGVADVRAERAWHDRLDDARQYHAAHGHLRPPKNTLVNGRRLDAWLSVQRTRHKNGELTPGQVAALEALHIRW
ncbi:Helicase associated domain protein [Streptomyces sp. NPDC001732]